MEHLVTIFGVYQYSNLAHAVTHVPFGQWCMKTSHHSFSVHGVSSSLPLSQQGPDGLPMPGCWQKVRWTNTEWIVCHFKHGASCLQCEQNKVALKNDFQVLIQFKGICRARSNSFENRQRNWKCYKTEKQNMPQIQKTKVSFSLIFHCIPVPFTSYVLIFFEVTVCMLLTMWKCKFCPWVRYKSLPTDGKSSRVTPSSS